MSNTTKLRLLDLFLPEVKAGAIVNNSYLLLALSKLPLNSSLYYLQITVEIGMPVEFWRVFGTSIDFFSILAELLFANQMDTITLVSLLTLLLPGILQRTAAGTRWWAQLVQVTSSLSKQIPTLASHLMDMPSKVSTGGFGTKIDSGSSWTKKIDQHDVTPSCQLLFQNRLHICKIVLINFLKR